MKNYARINDLDELKAYAKKLLTEGTPVGFDIETGYDGPDKEKASLHPEEAFVVGFSFSNRSDWARYAPLAHYDADNLDPAEVAAIWWPVMRDCKIVAHNAKFELRFMSRYFMEHLSEHPEFGEEVRASNGYFSIFSDTMVESYVNGRERTHGLKDLTLNVLGHEQVHIQTLFAGMKLKMSALRFNILPLSEEVIAYAAEDSAWCLALHNYFYPRVKDKKIYKIDMLILPILAKMEAAGLLYNWPAMRASAQELSKFIERLDAEIRQDLAAAIGEEQVVINLGSPKQIGDMLYNRMKLPAIRMTKGGAPSTDEKAITGLARKHPVVQRILDWRELTVLQTRYLEGFEKDYGYADDGRAHPSHAQTLVPSGRFACSDPNYQQSAGRYHQVLRDGSEYDCRFRKFIIAPPGRYMFGFDYSQIELRMTAGMSKEPAMLAAFESGIDVHAATAGAMYGIDPKNVTKEQRQGGKQLNFALLYGQGVNATADLLGISKGEAQELYDRYFAGFPTLKVWTQRTVDIGKQNGYVETIFGRKIVIWEFGASDRWIYAKGERLCVNAPVQGSAADYMRVAMIKVDKFLKDEGLEDKVQLVMNIHDALEFYVDNSIDAGWLAEKMRPVVSFPLTGFPDIRADFHYGPSWGELEEIEIGQVEDRTEPAVTSSVQDDVSQNPEPEEEVEIPTQMGNYAPEYRVAPMPWSENQIKSDEPDEHIVIVELEDFPYEGDWLKFTSYLHAHPGNNIVELHLKGQDDPVATLHGKYGLTPDHQARVAMIFGSVQVRYEKSSADTSAVLDGLTL